MANTNIILQSKEGTSLTVTSIPAPAIVLGGSLTGPPGKDGGMQLGGDLGGSLSAPKVKNRTFITIGPSTAVADFVCSGTGDEVKFQSAVDYCITNSYRKLVILDGAYEFNNVVKIKNPNITIEGSESGSVTISPSTTMNVSSATADAFFTIYDYSGNDAVLSNIKIKNIIFDWKNRIPVSNRAPSAVRYFPYQGNAVGNKPVTSGITSNTTVATIPSGSDVLYGWVENTTANACNVALTTTLPTVSTSSLIYPPATNFQSIPGLGAGAYTLPPITITTNNTKLGLLPAYFTITSMQMTNTTASPVTFKLQVKDYNVATDNPGDYTDISAEIIIPANTLRNFTSADLTGGVLPASIDKIVRINQGSSTWSGVNISIPSDTKTLTPVLIPHISVSGTPLGVLPAQYEFTKMVLTNNTGSSVNFKLQVRQYAAGGRDGSYANSDYWLTITSELTIPGSGSLTVRRSDLVNSLPSNNNVDVRIIQGAVAWSATDITLTSYETIFGVYDFYREVAIPGTTTLSGTGFTADAAVGTIAPGYYVKEITLTETAGHEWSGSLTDNNIAITDRVVVPASGTVTISNYGNSAQANAVVTAGAVTSATITNGGAKYNVAPLVQFQGNGTGAAGTANLTGGVVTSITITNGGSGYTQASIQLVSIQRYNYLDPLPYSEVINIHGLQATPQAYPQYTQTWNNASINVTLTLGVKVGIRREFMNEIFPQQSSRTLNLVSTDNNWNSASLISTIQFGAVSKNLTLENLTFRHFPNTGFGAVEVMAGFALDNNNAHGVHDGMYFKNLRFEDSYYPVQSLAQPRMTHMHFQSTFIRNVVFDDLTFSNLHGSSIMWHGDSGDSLPIIVVRGRKNILVKDVKFIRTKKGIFGGSRLEDWGDETRIGFKDLKFVRPIIEEGTDGWTADFGYQTEGYSTPLSLQTTGQQQRSGINFMNSENVVIESPRFIRVRTPLDYGYTNPPGNESHHVQVNNIYLEDCLELGDLDGTQAVQFNGGQMIRLRTTGKINHYGAHNPTIYNDVYFEDPGIQTSPSLVDKCLFDVHDGGVQFNDCVINLTQAQNVDYIFQEQNSNASSSLPIVYRNNKFMGALPNVATFGLNNAQYHRILNNDGVKESTIQNLFSGARDHLITPTAYLGVGYGNIKSDGTLIDGSVDLVSNQTIGGNKTFTNIVTGSAGFQIGSSILTITDQTTYRRIQSFSSTPLALNSAGNNVSIGSTIFPYQLYVNGDIVNSSGRKIGAELTTPVGVAAVLAAGGSLTLGTPRYYVLTAYDGVGETLKSSEVTATPSGGNQTINLSWTAVTGAVSYKVYMSTTSGTYTTPALIKTVTTNSYSDTGADSVASGAPPAAGNAFITKLTSLGDSWVNGGRLGVGTATPTAILHLKAGTTAASSAPLKLGAGTNMTTPEDGAIEYNGTHFYGSVGSTRYQLDQQGGIVRSISSISSPTTAGATSGTDYVYFVTGTTTLTLPTAVGNTNSYKITNFDASLTTTVATTSSQTIDGSTTITLIPNQSVEIISNNANWAIF